MANTHIQHFFNCLVPVYHCNLRCAYCFVTQAGMADGKELVHLDAEKLARALSVERAGLSLVNLCGHGETLLHPEIVPVVRELLAAGQYVAVVTNCTVTGKIKELCALPESSRARLFLKASFHYEQLKTRSLLAVYFENIARLHTAGISYSIELVASDRLAPLVPEILALFEERGEPLPQVLECRESVSGDIHRFEGLPLAEHTALWSQFRSPLFDGMQALWGERRKEFCYAGEYSVGLNLASGDMIQCNQRRALQNIYRDLGEPLRYCAVGRNCPLTHCYISYVWQGLCGNCKGVAFPSYDSQRNRRYDDGTEWLSPTVREAYHEVIGKAAGYYSGRKEHVVGALMDAWYRHEVREDDQAALAGWLAELLPAGRRIAVYGFGWMGRMIVRALQELPGRSVAAVADRCFEGRTSEEAQTSYERLAPEACWQGALASLGVTDVIVTPFADGAEIAKRMKEMYHEDMHIIGLLDALNQLS